MSNDVITTSFTETQKKGEEFAKQLKGGEVVALYGDLGSGKTTFMQGLAKGLGIERNIISPTFIIMRTYKVSRHSGEMKANPESLTSRSWLLQEDYPLRGVASQDDNFKIRTLYHLDLYRLENESQAVDLGLEELMGDPENVVAIEWPEKIENLLPTDRINIYFTYLTDNKREIRIG